MASHITRRRDSSTVSGSGVPQYAEFGKGMIMPFQEGGH
jgi:hypothetical protein